MLKRPKLLLLSRPGIQKPDDGIELQGPRHRRLATPFITAPSGAIQARSGGSWCPIGRITWERAFTGPSPS
jgi:hypothetical protein